MTTAGLAHYTEDQRRTVCGISDLPPGHLSYWKTAEYVTCPECLGVTSRSEAAEDGNLSTRGKAYDEVRAQA